MSTQPMPMVQVFSPDGTLGDIPYDKLHDALAAGAKPAAKFKAPDGTVGYVPADKAADAMKAGGTRVPLDLNDADGGNPNGFWQRGWKGLTTPLPRTPGSDEEAVREGSVPALEGLSTIGLAGIPGEAIATGSLAPLARAAVPLARGIVGSAAGGWLGREAGGLVGPKGAEVGGEVGGLAGGIYGVAGGKIPGNVAELNELLQSPEAKQRAAEEAQAGEINQATQIQDTYNRRVAREQAATAREQAATARQQAQQGKPQPITQSPNYDPAAYKAGAAERTSQPPAAAQPIKLSDLGGSSEGRPATWTNDTVKKLAAWGDTDAIEQAKLRGFGTVPKNFSSVEMNPKSVTHFDPQGNPIQLSDLSAQDYLHSLGRDVPDVEVSGGRTSANASGESSASLEAQSRLATEKNQGVQRVRVDTRSGQEVPLTGVDAVDAKAGPYDRIVMRDKNGAEIVLDEGQKALPKRPANPSGFRTGTPQ